MSEKKSDYQRIRDLPEEEREPFEKWMRGQTCPYVDTEPIEEQDFFYPWDYDRWKQGLPVDD